MSNQEFATTSFEDRVESFILAPQDHAWGDERARDEYYRAMAVAYYWAVPLALAVSLIAAAQGAKIAAYVALLLPALTQFPAYRYCSRRGVQLSNINKAFMTPRRIAVALAVMVPYLIIWAALMLEANTATLAGAAVGSAFGAGISIGIAAILGRRERAREARAALADDVF